MTQPLYSHAEMSALRAEFDAEREKSAELAAALVRYQRDLVVMQQERDELREDVRFLQKAHDEARGEALALFERVERERDEARGEVLGLQRMLEEALRPGFHASACPWCHRPLTKRGVPLHLPHCTKRPDGVGHA